MVDPGAVPDVLSSGQYATVYNLLSLVIASFVFTGLFLILSKDRVAPKYRPAIIVSVVVLGIAAYHYFRIFGSFTDAFVSTTAQGAGDYAASEEAFNEGYRYVDWFLTVPLLLLEAIAVLALPKVQQANLLKKLIPASALMIGLGYPGEISADNGTRTIFFVLSTIFFVYIVYVLFVELTKALQNERPDVAAAMNRLRILLVVSWLVYPIAYLMPQLGFDGSDAWVLKQAGYSIADIVAKAAFGLMIFQIALMKSRYDEEDAGMVLQGDGATSKTAAH